MWKQSASFFGEIRKTVAWNMFKVRENVHSPVKSGGPFESVDWMFSRRSFYGGDVGSFDCLIRFMTLNGTDMISY